jgi:hypothetical protein
MERKRAIATVKHQSSSLFLSLTTHTSLQPTRKHYIYIGYDRQIHSDVARSRRRGVPAGVVGRLSHAGQRFARLDAQSVAGADAQNARRTAWPCRRGVRRRLGARWRLCGERLEGSRAQALARLEPQQNFVFVSTTNHFSICAGID